MVVCYVTLQPSISQPPGKTVYALLLALDGKWDDRFSLTQVAERNNVGRGELRLHVRKVSGAKFKVEAVMSC